MATKPSKPLFPMGIKVEDSSDIKGLVNSGIITHSDGAVMEVPQSSSATVVEPSAARYNPDTDEFEGSYSDGWRALGGGGIRWESPTNPTNNTYNPEVGRGYFIDSRNNSAIIIMPSAPKRIGLSISFADLYGSLSVHPMTINGNGKKVYGSTENMVISTDNAAFTFTWTGDDLGWIITSAVGLGSGRTYRRNVFSTTLTQDTTHIDSATVPEMVDIFINGARVRQSGYKLVQTGIDFTDTIPSGSFVEVLEYKPIQLLNDNSEELHQVESRVTVLESKSDRDVYEVARSTNTKSSMVIFSTDLSTKLDGKTVLFDPSQEFIFGIPTGIPAGARIISVTGQNLTYVNSGTQTTVQLIDIFGALNNFINALASPNGATNIGLFEGMTLSNYFSKGRLVDPRMAPFNYKDSDSLANRRASIDAAMKYCNDNNTGLMISGYLRTDRVLMNGHTDYAIVGSGGFVCTEGSSPVCFEMKNCRNIHIGRGISINANRNIGTKIWGVEADGGTSLLNLSFTIIGASRAWHFGDESEPDALLSEIKISSAYTLDCGEVFYAYGSQCVVEFNGYQCVAGGQATPNGPTGQVRVGTAVGAVVHLNGGEMMKTNNTDGGMFNIQPINSPRYINAFGRITVVGSAIESASPWLVAHNPNSITNVDNTSGGISFIGCHGYYAGDTINFQAGDGFAGQITVDKTNHFHRTSRENPNNQKTTPTVSAVNGAAPVCSIDDSAFDSFFLKGFAKYSGTCVPLFGQRQVGFASNLNSQTLVGSSNQTTLKFTSVPDSSSIDNKMMVNCYNAATGEFTTPKGGLKNVMLYIQLNLKTAHANSDLYVMIGGTNPLATLDGSGRRISNTVRVGDLSEGDKITLKFLNGGSDLVMDASTADYITFYASR